MPSVTQVSSTQVPTVLVLLVTLPPPLVMPQARFFLVRLVTSSMPPSPLPPSVPLVELVVMSVLVLPLVPLVLGMVTTLPQEFVLLVPLQPYSVVPQLSSNVPLEALLVLTLV